MPHIVISGNLGKDAEYKQTQSGTELCSFPVADEAGYGDNKQTIWFDVTNWGKGSRGLADLLRKGSKVTVIGELTTREYEGKTYLQCRADKVKIHSAAQGEGGGGSHRPAVNAPADGSYDDLEDDVPFITADGIR